MRRKEKEITESEIIGSIFEKADVCHVAFADNNTPYIVTMNYGYVLGSENALFFHCAPEGRKIEMMKKNSRVCFTIDTDHRLYTGQKACDWGMKYRSVVGYGHLTEVTGADERKAALVHIMEHHGASGLDNFDERVLARTKVLRLDITEMTGKQSI